MSRDYDRDYDDIVERNKKMVEKGDAANKAATKIGALLYADYGLEIEMYKIRHFIKYRWDRLAPLAHIIHDAPDNTKYSSSGVCDAEENKFK